MPLSMPLQQLPLHERLSPLLIDSPFPEPKIPDRMTWTSSSVRLFRKCKRKWFWKHVARLRSKYRDKNLMVGSAFHAAIGMWYRGRRSSMRPIANQFVAKLRKEAVESQQYFNQDDWDKLDTYIQTFGGMMLGYENLYAGDKKLWGIQRSSIEQQFKINMGEFDFAGKVDLVAKIDGEMTVIEHKTSSRLRGSYIDRLPLDTQCRGYIFGATRGMGYKVKRVLYDVVVKSKLRRKSNETQDQFTERLRETYIAEPSRFFYREPLTFSPSDVDSFEFELRQTHQEYKQLIAGKTWADSTWLRGMGLLGPLSFKDPRAWAPNDATCDEFFRTCEYQHLCTTGLDRGSALQFQYEEDLNPELSEEVEED